MSNYILTRIEAIQQELDMLKRKVLTPEGGSAKASPQLKGIWKGVNIPEDAFEEAKRSLLSKDLRDKA
ncbi:MAG: hypothetical protein MUC48_04835 [Leptolyngbya sp. Prado105]|jgi:hypothetical protein|nr:hypothetical protein [Leptolyngbya sp. Prado105]